VYAFAGEFPTIAIIDFSSKGHTDLTYILPNLLSEKLLDTEMFDVLERENLKTLMNEIDFSNSGVVDEAKRIKDLQMIGSQYIMTGKILDYGTKQTSFKQYGIDIKTTINRLVVGIDIIETSTGRRVFSRQASAEKRTRESKNLSVVDDTTGAELANEVSGKLVDAMAQSKRL
jgi:curli biogenesis system outer membrane secretion channel CsgG